MSQRTVVKKRHLSIRVDKIIYPFTISGNVGYSDGGLNFRVTGESIDQIKNKLRREFPKWLNNQ